ncbi:MAG: dnaK 1 [Myxococcales bacterium]|nr:dnaK 1 [Myxococcales bacterium]
MSRIVGIDLGTTNSALAHIDPERGARIVSDEILQTVGAGEVLPRPTLPSFLYLAGEHELPPDALKLPWPALPGAPYNRIVGEFARTQGTNVPARLVSSAKSWLCHPRVDRLAPILPWGESTVETERISPVEASASYLRHMVGYWQHTHGRVLADEDVILCVPASFDEVARELTVRAAAEAGLERVTLLEEPQAAFYAWLADHATSELTVGDTVLVCDIGGGTTDFSLITVKEGPTFERTAVGDHLLLGGDNLDLALARRVEGRLMRGGKLDPHAFQQLVQACRVGKERLLGDENRAAWTVTIAGRSSKLIGGAMHDEITRADAEELVLDGFFPRVEAGAGPERRRLGIQEFGLPYAADPAITRHLAAFLKLHGARPTAVLWNGGVLKSAAIRTRILDVLAAWLGAAPRVLANDAPDLAVARGAAYYGLARRGTGVRITGGSARAYYLGIDTAEVKPGQVTVLCLTPRGFEEGAEVTLTEHALELLTNRPVRFRLFSSSDRVGDRAGELLTLPPDGLAELPPMYTVLRFLRSSHETALSVNLHAAMTEIGTLEVECVARATGNEQEDRWKLAFDLRAPEQRGEGQPAHSVSPAATVAEAVDPARIERAIAVLKGLYGNREAPAPVDPPSVMKELQAILGPKDSWSFTVLRALFEPLKDLRGGRGKSAPHEARWMNLVGYTLRPGLGYPLDDWRVKETWRLFNAGLVHDKDDPCKLEWWILWRRVSGGLTKTQQDEIFKRIAPHFLPTFAKKADRKPPGAQETAEMWRCVASMERIPAKSKSELGDVLVGQIEKKKLGEQSLWALGRLGARVPLYGPVEGVVARGRAEKWVERLLAMEWRGDAQALAAAEIARASGDRARDLDESLRRRLADRLQSAPEGGRLARLVLEPTAREAREERLAFGDSLPSGLRLVAEVGT